MTYPFRVRLYLLKMTKPLPLAKAFALDQEINDFSRSITIVGEYDRRVFLAIERNATDLQGPGRDVVGGSLARATLYSAAGKVEDAEKMFRNAELNHGTAPARINRMSHLANHGFASAAMALADAAFADRAQANFVDVAKIVFASGGFHKIVQKVDASIANKEVLKMNDLLDLSKSAVVVLDQLGVSDAQLAAMLDLAGQQLREHKLWWQGERPHVRVLAAGAGGPALLYDYLVHVTPDEAAAISWDLTDALVSHELDLHGVFIGFIGTNIPVRLAA